MNGDLGTRGAVAGAIAAATGVALGAVGAGAAASGSWWTLLIIAALLAGLGIGWLALYRSARDVRSVGVAADRLAEGELGERVVASSGPVGELTHTFNTMAARVQTLFESIAAEHARLEAVFDASTDAMVAISREGIVRFLNPAAVSIFGISMVGAVGRPFIEMARDYELDALVRRVIAVPGASETAVITFGATRRPLRAAAEPIVDGGDWAVLLMLTDLTEVQRVDQVRRDFLSNVSHELRTPLASISALVETLEDEATTDGIEAEFLRRIRQQVERLTMLVNELLDLSRIESGAIELKPGSRSTLLN